MAERARQRAAWKGPLVVLGHIYCTCQCDIACLGQPQILTWEADLTAGQERLHLLAIAVSVKVEADTGCGRTSEMMERE